MRRHTDFANYSASRAAPPGCSPQLVAAEKGERERQPGCQTPTPRRGQAAEAGRGPAPRCRCPPRSPLPAPAEAARKRPGAAGAGAAAARSERAERSRRRFGERRPQPIAAPAGDVRPRGRALAAAPHGPAAAEGAVGAAPARVSQTPASRGAPPPPAPSAPPAQPNPRVVLVPTALRRLQPSTLHPPHATMLFASPGAETDPYCLPQTYPTYRPYPSASASPLSPIHTVTPRPEHSHLVTHSCTLCLHLPAAPCTHCQSTFASVPCPECQVPFSTKMSHGHPSIRLSSQPAHQTIYHEADVNLWEPRNAKDPCTKS